MNIGTLTLEMAANVAKLQADMAQARSTVEGAMKGVENAVGLAKTAFIGLTGVASVAAFQSMVSGVIETKVELARLSQQTGASVESLSAISAVAKMTGTNIGDVGSAINKLQKNLATSNEDSKGAATALKALGINFEEFKAMKPDEQMLVVAKAMDKFQDGGGKSAAAMLLFGKTGAQMLPMLQELADKNELVGKQTTESAKQALEYEKNLKSLNAASNAWKRELVDGLLPTLVKVTDAMRKGREEGGLFGSVIAGIQTFLTGDDRYKNNKQLVDLTDQWLNLQNGLSKLKASGYDESTAAVRSQRAQIAAVEAQIKTAQAYGKVMDDQDQKESERERKREEERKKNGGVDVKVPEKTSISAADLYIANLAKEYANLSKEASKVDEVMEQLRIKDNKFTDSQREQAIALAKKIDLYRQAQREMESQNRALEAEAAAREEVNNAMADSIVRMRDLRMSMQDQIAVLGLTSDQAERVSLQRQLANEKLKLEQTLLQAVNDGLMTQAQANRDLATFTSQANQTMQQQIELQKKREDLRTDPSKGIDKALRDYQDIIRRQGDSWGALTTNVVSGFEDNMSAMLARGKGNWKSYFESIMQEAIKLQAIRPLMQQLFSPGGGASDMLKGVASGSGLNFGSLAGLFGRGGGFGTGSSYGNMDLGGFFADGGRPPLGKPSVVGERGPELWVPDTAGTIVPNGGGGSTINYAPVIKIDARADQSQIMSLVGRALQENNQRLTGELQRQGVLS